MILLILPILFNSCIWRETTTGIAIATFLFCLIYIIYRGTIYILDNLNAAEFCDAIQGTYSQISASEWASIEKVLAQKENIKSSFIRTLRQHLVNFSEGIAASIVANQLQK